MFISQLPRVKITAWKQGSIGVPTFHCIKCMKRWLKLGRIPESCSEAEDLMEGPAMYITRKSADKSDSAEMIVGGALGYDGKPVRIKVELPVNLRGMLKKGHKKKNRRIVAEKEDGKITVSGENTSSQVSEGEIKDAAFSYPEDDFLDSNSSSEGDDTLDIPESFRKFILKKAVKQVSPSKSSRLLNIPKREEQKSRYLFNDWSVSDFTTSSLSSLASNVGSEELLKYFESGDSEDEFLSDKFSFDSQLDTVEGENTLKPFKQYKSSKRAVENGRASSMEMLYSDDNVTQLASTKSQSEVRNHEEVTRKRSRSFPDPRSGSTHLPPIKGVPSSQSYVKYSSRRWPQRKLRSNAQLTSNSNDEEAKFSVLQGHSFHSMDSKIGSFANEEDSNNSSNCKADVAFSKDKDKDTDMMGHKTRSRTRDGERRNHGSIAQSASENKLCLPNISNRWSSVAQSETSSKNGTDGDQNKNREKQHSQTSQYVHLPQLKKDKGIMTHQQGQAQNSSAHYSGNVTRGSMVNTDQQITSGIPATKSKVDIPESFTQSNQDGYSLNSGPAENIESESLVHFVPSNDIVSSSAMSQRSSSISSSAVDNRRRSMQTPSFLVQERRPSRVSHATVKEDVELPVGRSKKGRVRPPVRQRNKRSEEMPLLKKLSENNLNKTLSSHLPDKPDLPRRQSMEMKSFHGDDNIPRRIGHKLVKKRKGEDHTRDSAAMHNSKDIGEIGDDVDTANQGSKGAAAQSSSSRWPSAFLSIEEDSNAISQSPLSTSLRANQDAASSFGNNSFVSMGGGPGTKQRPVSGGMGSKLSSNYPPVSTLLQSENNNNTSSPFVPPVRLKPLDPTQIVNSDPNTPTMLQQPQAVVLQNQMEEGEQGILGSTDVQPMSEGEKNEGGEEEGLEAIMEESEPESDDDDEYFNIRPIPELKPVSTLSFSSNVFSYFRMGKAHKQAYHTVHQKATGPTPPKKWGRSQRTPAKMVKRRKR